MKSYRALRLASAFLLAALPLAGCGNALDDEGSSPSGSYITADVDPQLVEQDIYLQLCSSGDFESGITEGQAVVTIYNDSLPNTPAGQATNHDVRMSRYRVDYTGQDKSVHIPSFDGGGASIVVPADGSAKMTVVVMPYSTQEYIRSHYLTTDDGSTLNLRATVTVWGEDVFHVTVSEQVQLTVTVANFDRCAAK
jgi:hypothetical protein